MSTVSLSKMKFQQIADDLTGTTLSQKTIAGNRNVGQTTVSKVNTAGTYINFRKGRKAKQPLRPAQPLTSAQKEAIARKQNLNPQTASDRREKRFAKELERLDNTPTRDEFKHEISALHTRIDTLSAVYRGLATNWLFRALFGKTVVRAIDRLVAEERGR
jgi:hypothetical protein